MEEKAIIFAIFHMGRSEMIFHQYLTTQPIETPNNCSARMFDASTYDFLLFFFLQYYIVEASTPVEQILNLVVAPHNWDLVRQHSRTRSQSPGQTIALKYYGAQHQTPTVHSSAYLHSTPSVRSPPWETESQFSLRLIIQRLRT